MCPPHLNNVLTLPCENETVILHTHHALLEYEETWQDICDHNSWKSWWILISFACLKTGMNALCKHWARCVRNQSSWDWWAARSQLCACGIARSSRWLTTQLTNGMARLRACVRANGGHFEHTLWQPICFLCMYLMNCMLHITLDAENHRLSLHYNCEMWLFNFSSVA